MIHIAIYDRNPAVGLELGDLSPRFPEEYRSRIQQISEAFGTPEDPGIPQRDALRYTPLGEKYLLSVIQRMNDRRRYNRIVHYLMDRREAEYMLRWDLRALLGRLLAEAGNSAQAQQEVFSRENWAEDLPLPGTQSPKPALRHALFTGACLSDSTKKVRLVLPEGEDLSLQLLGWLLSQLPAALRIQVRFNSNVTIPPEGNGCCLLFCSPEANGLFERGVSGGELADVCLFSLREECDQSLLRQEFEYVLPLLEASPLSRKNALALFGREGDWEKYLSLLCIPYDSPREELRDIAALCGSDTAAQLLDSLGYPRKKLESLARNAPEWLRSDLVLYQAVMKYREVPGPGGKSRNIDALAAPSVLSRDTAEPDSPAPPARKRKTPSGNTNPAAALVLLLGGLVIALAVVTLKLLLSGLVVDDQTVSLVITASAYRYLLRSAALALSCTALGASLVLLVQQIHRLFRPRRKGRRG